MLNTVHLNLAGLLQRAVEEGVFPKGTRSEPAFTILWLLFTALP